MRKRGWLVIRLAIALAGLAYIVLNLTWSDQVVVPTQPGSAEAAKAYPVAPHGLAEWQSTGHVVVLMPDERGLPWPVRLKVSADEDDPDQPHFRPGILTVLHQADYRLLLAGWLLIGPTLPLQVVRWRILLRARGLEVGFWKAFRLVMVATFFNYCMPGTTGGDVVKAYYAAKGSQRKADSIMSVVIDRVCGLFGLIVLGGVAGLFLLDHPQARPVTAIIWLIAGVSMVGGAIYYSGRLRRALGVSWMLERLPGHVFLQKVDQAAVAYRQHQGSLYVSVALSVLNHVFMTVGTSLAGYALGVRQPLTLLMTALSVLFLAGSIPISYQGLGIMEAFGKPMLVAPTLCTVNQLFGMLMLIRFYQIVYSLVGVVFLFQGDIQFHQAHTEAENGAQTPAPGAIGPQA